MFCKNCGKEIDDSSKFCQYCGANLTASEVDIGKEITKLTDNIKAKKNIFTSLLKIAIVPFVIFILCITYIKSPECTVYNAISAIKDNDYTKATEYINLEKITNNRINAYMEDAMNDKEMQDNPFAGLAYMFTEALKPKLVSVIQKSFKDVVESPDNIFQQVSKPQLMLFTCIKHYDKLSLQKTINEPKKVEFKFSDGDKVKDLHVVLNKTSDKKWEIVDIYGYDFWQDDNAEYLQHNKQVSSSNKNNYNKTTEDKLLEIANTCYAQLKESQIKYSMTFWYKNQEEKEKEFLKILKDYNDTITKLNDALFKGGESSYTTNDKYFKENKEKYEKLGIGTGKAEAYYNVFEPNYKILINTFGIPKNWKERLSLIQKYIDLGEEMTIKQIEEGVIEFEKIENKSEVIDTFVASEDEYSSKRFFEKYTWENYFLNPKFDEETDKILQNVLDSYKHFLATYKDSKYYPLLDKYYKKLEKNKFKWSLEASEWIETEIEKLK